MRCSGQLRDGPAVVRQVRASLRKPTALTASAPRRQVAPRRGVHQDQRYPALPVAGGRPGRQRARRAGPATPKCCVGQVILTPAAQGCRVCAAGAVTDNLGSYGVAHRKMLSSVEHRESKYLNNRAENSHQPTARAGDERFTSAGHAQRFLSAFSGISPYSGPAATGSQHWNGVPRYPTASRSGRKSPRQMPPPESELPEGGP